MRPVETIQQGDHVWAYDILSREWLLSPVYETMCGPTETNYATVTYVADDGTSETIDGTGGHPYWVLDGEDLDSRPRNEHQDRGQLPEQGTTPGRWVDAQDLRPGDLLLLCTPDSRGPSPLDLGDTPDDEYDASAFDSNSLSGCDSDGLFSRVAQVGVIAYLGPKAKRQHNSLML